MPATPADPPKALGNIVPIGGFDEVPEGSPPSSYAAASCARGDAGALPRMFGLTLLRALLIAPGVAMAGVRGKQLVYGSLAGSGLITVSALLYAWAGRRASMPPAAQALPYSPNTEPPIDVPGESVEPAPVPPEPSDGVTSIGIGA